MNVSANSDQALGPNACFDNSLQYANNSPVHVGLLEDKSVPQIVFHRFFPPSSTSVIPPPFHTHALTYE